MESMCPAPPLQTCFSLITLSSLSYLNVITALASHVFFPPRFFWSWQITARGLSVCLSRDRHTCFRYTGVRLESIVKCMWWWISLSPAPIPSCDVPQSHSLLRVLAQKGFFYLEVHTFTCTVFWAHCPHSKQKEEIHRSTSSAKKHSRKIA